MEENNSRSIQEVQLPHLELQITSDNLRSTIAQITYSIAMFMLAINLGVNMNYISIALPLLINGNAGIKIQPKYSSYLVSSLYLFVTIGCLLIKLLGKWGRKPLMIWSVVFIELSWIVTYFAQDIWALLIGRFFGGIATGLSLTIHATIAETCEPRLRGVLHTLCSGTLSAGASVASFMGILNNFRLIAFINIFLPLINVLYICFLPESPLWLCTEGRYNDALESLIWLRGWQCTDAVKREFSKLKLYCLESRNGGQSVHENQNVIPGGVDNPIFEEDNQSTLNVYQIQKRQVLTECKSSQQRINRGTEIGFRNPCKKWFGSYKVEIEEDIGDHCQAQRDTDNSDHFINQSDSILDNIKCLFSKEMFKPISILTMLAFYVSFTPNIIFASYLPLIMEVINKQANYQIGQVVYASSLIIGHLASIGLVKYVGKRRILLYSMLSSALNSFCFTLYEVFKQDIQWLLFVLIFWNGYANSSGPTAVIFTIIGELLPIRGRLLGAGLIYNALSFSAYLTTLTFPYIFSQIPFYLIMFVYGVIYIAGYIFINIFLIETEGKTLQQIKLELDH